jgi:membrane-associated phospholipid phosphatase
VTAAALSERPRPRSSASIALREALRTLNRPYRVTLPMVALVLLVPFYVFIPVLLLPGRVLHTPELPLDRLVPLSPSWALVYGVLYLFLIVLPVLAVRDEEHIRRTVLAYLAVWIAAFVCFVAYPTVAPRPATVVGHGFGAWGLRLLYSADPPYNCFPSLHVAHSFVSALTCFRLNPAVGVATVLAASLVGISTLYTKQHYILDVAAGIVLASIAYLIFLRAYFPARGSAIDRRTRAVLAAGLIVLLSFALAGSWAVYRGVG